MGVRHGSLFSGIGMIDYGLELANFETAWQVEIDPYCTAVLERHWPGVPRYKDVKECGVGRRHQLERVDLISGGFPCFGDGTLVLTYRGFIPIENVRVGDLVLTHLGRWQKVTSTMSRYAQTARLITGMGILPTLTTDEHPYFSRTKTRIRHRYPKGWGRRRGMLPQAWALANELGKDSMLGQVLPPVRNDRHTEAFWWLVGRYLAEGWLVTCNGKGRVVICANYNEADELAGHIEEAGYRYSKDDSGTVAKFHITRASLHRFLLPFGQHAYGKTLPGWTLSLSAKKARSLLDGYFTGDGSPYRNRGGGYGGERASSVSPALSLGIALLTQRAFGVVASLFYTPSRGDTIEGRTVSQRDSYQVQYPKRNRCSVVEGIYGWKPVRENKPAAGCRVHNLSVENDESYVANGAIVHNCTDISIAGHGPGIGTPDSPTARSGLWYEYYRLVREMHPKWAVIENVARLLHTDDGAGVIFDMEKEGYACWAFPTGKPRHRNAPREAEGLDCLP